MIEIAGGWFWMGSDERPDERPVHRVWVDRFDEDYGFRVAWSG